MEWTVDRGELHRNIFPKSAPLNDLNEDGEVNNQIIDAIS